MSGTGDKAGTRGGETTRKTRNKTKHENTLPTTREFQPRLGPHSVCTTHTPLSDGAGGGRGISG